MALMEPEFTLHALPKLLSNKEDRERAMSILEWGQSLEGLTKEQRDMIGKITAVLSENRGRGPARESLPKKKAKEEINRHQGLRSGMDKPPEQKSPHHVVIIGGGFGGLYAARTLNKAPVRVTLVDRRNFHLFQPLLYQVATGILGPGEITAPLRHILRKAEKRRRPSRGSGRLRPGKPARHPCRRGHRL